MKKWYRKQHEFIPADLKSVEYLEGWNLLITYVTGEKRVCNCDDIPTSTREIDEPLKDIEYFKKAYINEGGFLCWDEIRDVCPDGLYENSIPYGEYLAQKGQR